MGTARIRQLENAELRPAYAIVRTASAYLPAAGYWSPGL
jgi:hypothetical protein